MNLRTVLFVLGILLSILGIAMLLPAIFQFYIGLTDRESENTFTYLNESVFPARFEKFWNHIIRAPLYYQGPKSAKFVVRN